MIDIPASVPIHVVGSGPLATGIRAALVEAGLTRPSIDPRPGVDVGFVIIVNRDWRDVMALLARRCVVLV